MTMTQVANSPYTPYKFQVGMAHFFDADESTDGLFLFGGENKTWHFHYARPIHMVKISFTAFEVSATPPLSGSLCGHISVQKLCRHLSDLLTGPRAGS